MQGTRISFLPVNVCRPQQYYACFEDAKDILRGSWLPDSSSPSINGRATKVVRFMTTQSDAPVSAGKNDLMSQDTAEWQANPAISLLTFIPWLELQPVNKHREDGLDLTKSESVTQTASRPTYSRRFS